jgi:endonuclease/exonuclease/phosphatase family metal-dependent hydrolase
VRGGDLNGQSVRVAEGVLRVVELNVDSVLGPRWPERRLEIVSWLDALNPDVVCLQEIWQDDRHPNTGGWIAEHAADEWRWEFGGFAPPDPDAVGADLSMRFGSAILSRWPVDAVELMCLPVSDDEPGQSYVTSRPQGLPRGMPFELLHVRTAGVDVYSTHLQPPPRQAYHRVRQVVFIDDAIRRTCDPASSMPPTLCGDFNAEPTSDEIRFLTAKAVIDGRSTYFQDAWTAVHDRGGMTQDLANDLYAGLNIPPKRIDYVFVGETFLRPDGAGRVLRAGLAFNEPRTGTFASDHYGLSVDIVWPNRPSTPNHRRP